MHLRTGEPLLVESARVLLNEILAEGARSSCACLSTVDCNSHTFIDM